MKRREIRKNNKNQQDWIFSRKKNWEETRMKTRNNKQTETAIEMSEKPMKCEKDEYRDFYEPIIMEEFLPAMENPLKIANGKCSVIGKVMYSEGKYYLENIQLPFLPQKYRIPGSKINIALLNLPNPLEENKCYEVFGDIVLHNCLLGINNGNCPVSGQDIIRRMERFMKNLNKNKSINGNEVTKAYNLEILKLSKIYKPAIVVHSACLIDNPLELIKCNLEQRLLMKQIDEQLELRTKNTS